MDFKTFESEIIASPAPAPAKPKPKTRPGPGKPGTKPTERPGRPGPIRRGNPSVDPRPKAELEELLDKFDELAEEKDKQEIVDYYKNKNN